MNIYTNEAEYLKTEVQRLSALVRAQQITIDKLEQALAAPVQEPVAHNICTGCANSDSWGLPDKPVCRSCVSNSEWKPLNVHSKNPVTTPPAAPVQEPVAVDQATMELAESVGLIGPASRTHDLHAAIQRFHDLICVNATIKAAKMAADAIRESNPPVAQRQWVGLTDDDKCVKELYESDTDPEWIDGYTAGLKDAENKLRRYNAQPALVVEQLNPVAEVKLKQQGGNAGFATVINEIYDPMREPLRVGDKLYTSLPAQRTWVGLTDEEIGKAWSVADGEHNASASVKRRITRAIEAKLKEKNK